jgi:hypothetical protein
LRITVPGRSNRADKEQLIFVTYFEGRSGAFGIPFAINIVVITLCKRGTTRKAKPSGLIKSRCWYLAVAVSAGHRPEDCTYATKINQSEEELL